MRINTLLQFICATLTLITLISIPTQAITAEEFDKAWQNSVTSYTDINSNCSFLYCENSDNGYYQNQRDNIINATFDPYSIENLINKPLESAFQNPECKFELGNTSLSVTKVENLGSLGNGSSDYLVSGLIYNPCTSKLSQKIYINYEQNYAQIQPIESMVNIPREINQNNYQFGYYGNDLGQISNFSIKINVLDKDNGLGFCISFDRFCNQKTQLGYTWNYTFNSAYQNYQNYLPTVSFNLPELQSLNLDRLSFESYDEF